MSFILGVRCIFSDNLQNVFILIHFRCKFSLLIIQLPVGPIPNDNIGGASWRLDQILPKSFIIQINQEMINIDKECDFLKLLH